MYLLLPWDRAGTDQEKEEEMNFDPYDNWNNNFDRSFAKMEKRVGLFAGFGLAAWVVFVLIDLALLAGIVFVAIHFLGKVW